MAVASQSGQAEIPGRYAPYVPPALEKIDIPAYILDRDGRIRWMNAAAASIAGNSIGKLFTSVLAPEDAVGAWEIFERNLTGAPHADYSIDVVGGDGSRTQVEVSSAALGPEGHAIGMFGLAVPVREGERPAPRVDPRLTARQREVLALLCDGASTEHIAKKLSLSRETVRNHVRHILRRLDARSRLEAVAVAHRDHLV
jgi:DNA-binding CsgD family transcriptional regulator